MMIGMAKVDLTPDVRTTKVRLNGYSGRRRKAATGVHDPVFARALVGKDAAGRLFAVVGLDLCYVSAELRARVLALVSPHGFTDESVLLAATHTHSSFAGYDRSLVARLLMGPFDARLLEDAARRIAAAVLQAQTNLRPATLASATVRVPALNRSRLDPAFEFGEVEGAPKEFDRAKYPTDEELTAIRVADAGGRPLGAVIHFAAHPTVLSPKNLEVSADYVGVLLDRVEEHLGPGAVGIFLNSTLGDTAPLPDWVDDLAREYEMMNEYGRRLSGHAIDALDLVQPMNVGDAVFRAERREFRNVVVRSLGRRTLPLSLSRAFYTDPSVPLQALRLGDLVFLAVPGEPTTAVGQEILAACPAGHRCRVVAPANGYLGYFVTDAEYEAGGYAAHSCFFGTAGVRRMEEGLTAALRQVTQIEPCPSPALPAQGHHQ